MGDGGDVAYTLYVIENGRLTEDFTISVHDTFEADGVRYYLRNQPITEEEFNETITRYDLDNVEGGH